MRILQSLVMLTLQCFTFVLKYVSDKLKLAKNNSLRCTLFVVCQYLWANFIKLTSKG